MTFLLSEDQALRELLTGITVSDQKSTNDSQARVVGVWFGQPDQEIRSQSYPYMTIDMIDIVQDRQREMRGKTSAEYLQPSSLVLGDNQDFEVDLPIPVNIDYQITTFSRHPRHDRQIMGEVMYSRLPFRFGTLDLDDGTVRRLDVLGVAKRDLVEQGKRLFMNAITVRVSSEIAQRRLTEFYKVQSVYVEPTDLSGWDTFSEVITTSP
jgi:hypothetical protein